MMRGLRGYLGENDMMASLTMMADRLLELHRVLKRAAAAKAALAATLSSERRIIREVLAPEP